MEAPLRALLEANVQFQPVVGRDPHGQATYGALIVGVPGRVEYDQGKRVQQDREERIYKSGRVFLDGPDFDPNVVKVGSKIMLPDGTERIVEDIRPHFHAANDPFYQTGIHHWTVAWV